MISPGARYHQCLGSVRLNCLLFLKFDSQLWLMKMLALMLNLDVYSKCQFQMFVRDVDSICLMLMSMLVLMLMLMLMLMLLLKIE